MERALVAKKSPIMKDQLNPHQYELLADMIAFMQSHSDEIARNGFDFTNDKSRHIWAGKAKGWADAAAYVKKSLTTILGMEFKKL